MKIGIDISQTAYENTGVANYVLNLVQNLLTFDTENEYVLFFSSLRRPVPTSLQKFLGKKTQLKYFKLPPIFLDILWNKLHIFPIEWFIGPVDVFISSDWTQPPSKAKKVTILYDLIVLKFPQETHNQLKFSLKEFNLKANIVESQKRRLRWVQKECDKVICISESTKQDAIELLKIDKEKLQVVYPGL